MVVYEDAPQIVFKVMSKEPSTSAETATQIAELTELIGGLAHELRNPLSTVMINLRLLAEDLANTDTNIEDMRRRALRKVQVLQHEAQRLQSLFDEFLSLTGPRKIQTAPMDLRETIDRLTEFLDPLARSNGIELVVAHDAEPPEIEADEPLIRRALLNLLINAQQAMPDGGAITISTRCEDANVVIDVRDEGVGIAPQELERIVRPFFSTKPEGNGLGLSIVRRIAEDHGGRLLLTSTLGKGTTATIVLPRSPEASG